MGTWEIKSTLEDLEGSEIFEAKKKALEYLHENPFDTVGAAKICGFTFGQFLELRGMFFEDFQQTEKIALARMETMLVNVALGKEKEESAEFSKSYSMTTRITTAKWILERRDASWKTKNEMTLVNNMPIAKPNGRGQELLEKWGKKENETRKEAFILSDNTRH